MKVILVYQNDALGRAWKEDFRNEKNVSIIKEDIIKVKCDAIVSPANSFGFMDGGLDLALTNYFGSDLEVKLKESIQSLEMKELLVGQSLLIETNHDEVPFLISSPTMRVPMNFQINTSLNAYLAMKSTLLIAQRIETIQSIAIPGLCVGTGGMNEVVASNQMFLAYEEVMNNKTKRYRSVVDMHNYQLRLNEKANIWRNEK